MKAGKGKWSKPVCRNGRPHCYGFDAEKCLECGRPKNWKPSKIVYKQLEGVRVSNADYRA